MAAKSDTAARSENAPTKYDELRLKTDRQLIHLVNLELDLGIRDAREALQSAENRASARCYYRLAEAAHRQATRLIRLTEGKEEPVKTDARLAQLQEMLEGLSVLNSGATPDGGKTPALARAFWKAKGCPEGSAEEDWFQAERLLRSA